ncbi:hypothetical protein ABK040_003204 [Willaertia magna]
MINPNKKHSFYASLSRKTEKKRDVKIYVWERILNEADKLEDCRNDLSLIINEKERLKKIIICGSKKEKQFRELLKDIEIVSNNYLFKKGNLGWSIFTKVDLVLKSKEIINDLPFYLISTDRNLSTHNFFIFNTNKSNCIMVGPLSLINHHCDSPLGFKEDAGGNLIGFYNKSLNTVTFPKGSELFIQYNDSNSLGFDYESTIRVDNEDDDFSDFEAGLLSDNDLISESDFDEE